MDTTSPSLETTVTISGVVVEAGDTVPLTMNTDGSRNYRFQRQVFNGVYHRSTVEILQKFKNLITGCVLKHTTMNRDVASIIASYIDVSVPTVQRMINLIREGILNSVAYLVTATIRCSVTFSCAKHATIDVTTDGLMSSNAVFGFHKGLSHEVMVFYMDLLSEWCHTFTLVHVRLKQLRTHDRAYCHLREITRKRKRRR